MYDAYSTESQNPSRLHYLPSHPPGMSGIAYRYEGSLVAAGDVWIPPHTERTAIKGVDVTSRASGTASSAGLEELAHILKSIPPELEYPDWFRCIAAVFHETKGSEAGSELAHEWSSGDPRYDFAQVDGIWDDLELEHRNPAGIGTLIKLAREFDKDYVAFQQKKSSLGNAFDAILNWKS